MLFLDPEQTVPAVPAIPTVTANPHCTDDQGRTPGWFAEIDGDGLLTPLEFVITKITR